MYFPDIALVYYYTNILRNEFIKTIPYFVCCSNRVKNRDHVIMHLHIERIEAGVRCWDAASMHIQ